MDRYIQFAARGRHGGGDGQRARPGRRRPRRASASPSAAPSAARPCLEDEYVARQQPRPRVAGRPRRTRAPFLLPGARARARLATEVALQVRRARARSVVVSTGCTSGIDAIGYAHQLIQDGEADIVHRRRHRVAASRRSRWPASTRSRRPRARNDDPEHASRPFDRDRDGFVHGRGRRGPDPGGARARASAAARTIYCEVAGFASRGNAFHMTGLRPTALEMAEAIDDALRPGPDSTPDDIDYINAHGSGTKQNDRHETAAFKRALGEHAYQIPISSIKSMVGHSLGAIGAIEMAACALAIEHGVVPPTANCENPDPECDLDYTPERRARSSRSTSCSVDGQRLRRLPVGDGASPARAGGRMTRAVPDRAGAAVITGIGVVAPNGIGTDAWWKATLRRASAASAGSRASTRRSYADAARRRGRRLRRRRDYIDAAAASCRPTAGPGWRWPPPQMALDDAGFDPADARPVRDERRSPRARRAATSSARGRSRTCGRKGPRFVGAYQSIAWFYAATHRPDLDQARDEGPVRRRRRRGRRRPGRARPRPRARSARGADAVVSGGTEAPLGPYALACQLGNGRAERRRRDPDGAYRPFDARANGYVPGEGGAILLVEELRARRASAARRRSTARSPATPPRTTATTTPSRRPTARSSRGRCRLALERRRRRARRRRRRLRRRAPASPEADAAEAQAITRGASATRADGAGHRAEDDDRPAVRRRRVARRRHRAAGDARRRDPADDQPRAARRGLRPRPRHRQRRARPTSRPCSIAARGFGGFNSALVLRRDV